jgi:hypothetical protein
VFTAWSVHMASLTYVNQRKVSSTYLIWECLWIIAQLCCEWAMPVSTCYSVWGELWVLRYSHHSCPGALDHVCCCPSVGRVASEHVVS